VKRSLLTAAVLPLFLHLLSGRPSAQEENKVIVKDFSWGVYATRHFDIHYYGASREWLPFAADALEKAYERVSGDLNPAMNKRIPFFLFASINDMQQSNVADAGDGIGGLTEPFKDRFMVWSDGSKAWLENVITHEFAHEAQFSVLIDGFWKSARILKTFVYPLWMMEGIAEYETGNMDLSLETMYVRDAALSPGGLISLVKLSQFSHLKPHQITLAYKTGGQAIRFLAGQYGKDKPARMLELFRSRYDASSVLMPLIGLDLAAFDRKFREYAELKYLAQVRDEGLNEPERYGDRLTSEAEDIPEFNTSPVLSPDGGRLAYLSTAQGHPPVLFIKDLAKGLSRKIVIPREGGGAENVPYGRFSRPLKSLSWSPDGKYLAFSGQKNHREYIFLYEPSGGRFTRLAFPDLAEVRQPVFSPDSSRIMFVGMRGGFNDIYEADLSAALKTGSAGLDSLRRLTEGTEDESSPAYLPDGSGAVYSCERDYSAGPRRELCRAVFGGAPETLARLPGGDVYDPVPSPDGRGIVFVSDVSGTYELYELDTASSSVSRLTRVIGGNFTPSYSRGGDRMIFSSFRRGSMNVYRGAPENFTVGSPVPALPVEGTQVRSGSGPAAQPEAGRAAAPDGAAPAEPAGKFRPYRFKASTDLFFPVLMFSSPGGLFLTAYWQGSDMLGDHNAAGLVNYNSAGDYLNYQMNYSYARHRMPLLLQASGVTFKDAVSEHDLEFDRQDWRFAAGTAYPFDRYNRLEVFAIRRDVTDKFEADGRADHARTRAGRVAYVRDTVSGLYLTAVRGSRTELSYTSAGTFSGGSEVYGAGIFQRLQYFPLSKRSAFVDRFLAGSSAGPGRRSFDFGGLGGVRGFSSSSRWSGSKLLMNNFEFRTPIVRDMNYYMWFMFPDFYFKAVYAKAFFDSAFGWDRGAELRGFSGADIRSSAGVGINVHTFILQAFQFVLSFDYAVRTYDGGRIFYFYLGPLF